MPVPRSLIFAGAATLLLAALLAGSFQLSSPPAARALPPAGTDELPVSVEVDVLTRAGREQIILNGLATIQRGDPRIEGGVEVVDAEVTALNLTGTSSIGQVTVHQSAQRVSSGQIRSLQPGQQFPASVYFDIFFSTDVPGSPAPFLRLLRNDEAVHLAPMIDGEETSINAWPPAGTTFSHEPLFGVDNDGDGQIDEDTADDDNDGMIDEDPPPGFDEDGDGRIDEDRPFANQFIDNDGDGLFDEDGGPGDEDTDGRLNEDPSTRQCIEQALAICDNDGDGQIDEDPRCIPLFPQLPLGVCIITMSFRVEFLGANDNFEDARAVSTFPFLDEVATRNATVQTGEPQPLPSVCGSGTSLTATVWYAVTPPRDGTLTIDTTASEPGGFFGYDTVLAVYTGSSLATLQNVACNDDADFALQSRISMPVEAGVTYYIQAGGYPGSDISTGELHIRFDFAGEGEPTSTPTPTRSATPPVDDTPTSPPPTSTVAATPTARLATPTATRTATAVSPATSTPTGSSPALTSTPTSFTSGVQGTTQQGGQTVFGLNLPNTGGWTGGSGGIVVWSLLAAIAGLLLAGWALPRVRRK